VTVGMALEAAPLDGRSTAAPRLISCLGQEKAGAPAGFALLNFVEV